MTNSLNLAVDFNFTSRWLGDIRLVLFEIFRELRAIILFWATLVLIKQAWVHLWLVLSKWSKLYDMQGYNQGKANMARLR
jgi:hypothetical protein